MDLNELLSNLNNIDDISDLDNYKFEIINAVPMPIDIAKASQYNSSVFNLTECELSLKAKNVLSDKEKLKIMKIDFSSTTNTNILDNIHNKAGNSIQYKLVKEVVNDDRIDKNSIDRYVEVDTQSCNGTQMKILVPFERRAIKADVNTILYFKDTLKVDLFNISDPFFNDACINYIDQESNFDTTRQYRRDNYFQNTTIACSFTNSNQSSCVSKGLDAMGFIICECEFQDKLEISSKFIKRYFNDTITSNKDIIKCYNQFIKTNTYFSNIGFMCSFVIVGSIALYTITNALFLKSNFIKNNYTKIINNDLAKSILPEDHNYDNLNPPETGLGKLDKKDSESNISSSRNEKINNVFTNYDNYRNNRLANKEKKVGFANNLNHNQNKLKFNFNLDSVIEKDNDLNKSNLKNKNKLNLNINNNNNSPINSVKNIVNNIQDDEEFTPYSENNFNNNINSNDVSPEKKVFVRPKSIMSKDQIDKNKKGFEQMFIPKVPNSDILTLNDNKQNSTNNNNNNNIENCTTSNRLNAKIDIDSLFDDINPNNNYLNSSNKENEDIKKFNNFIDYNDGYKSKYKVTSGNELNTKNNLVNDIRLSQRTSSDDIVAKLNFNSKDYMKRDFAYMDTNERLELDNRKNFQYFCDVLKSNHILLNLFYFKSIINPIGLRIMYFGINCFFIFIFNAMFIEDHIITNRIYRYKYSSSLEYSLNLYLYPIISLVIAIALRLFYGLIIKIPNSFSAELNECLISKEIDIIKKSRKEYSKKLRIKTLLIFLLFIMTFAFSAYYLTIFCNIYITTSKILLICCILSIIADLFVLSLIFPILLTIYRAYAKSSNRAIIVKCYELIYFFRIV